MLENWLAIVLLSRITVFRKSQFAKAFVPILVTVDGNVMVLMPVQPLNVSEPIVRKVFDNVTFISPLQFWNAPFPMVVTLFGMTIPVSSEQPLNALVLIVISSLGKIKLLNAQSLNALMPIVVTWSGIEIVVKSRLLQP